MPFKGVLIVDPDGSPPLEAIFREGGVAVTQVADAEAAWRSFIQAPPDLLITTLTTARRDAAWLLRRMQEDYLGSLPPVYLLVSVPELRAGLPRLDIDGALLRPAGGPGLDRLLSQRGGEEDPAAQSARLRDLFDLTLLAGDLDIALKLLVDRAARAFRSHDCVLVLAIGERRLYAHRTPETAELREALAARCELAASAGTTLIYSGHTTCPSHLAVPLEAPTGGVLGTLCLVSDHARRFLVDERQNLRALARRAGAELAYRWAHDRLASEHDRLRQTAVLDPLLGVLTRLSLEDAAAAELRRGDACLAVVDLVGLRHVNERYGHLAGDAVLQQLSERVQGALRPGDVLGRVGGDELGVLLPNADHDQAHELCESILHAVAATPFAARDQTLDLRVRIGAATSESGTPAGVAVERARRSLREAREAGASLHIQHGPPTRPRTSSTLDLMPTVGRLLAPGTTLGGIYRILHEISHGAMGVVYRAEDLGLSRPVAVKVLRPELSRDAALVERFRGEAAMLASVRHENLVAVHSLGTQADLVYFVMELVEGESLHELLSRVDAAGEAVPLELCERAVLQVASALEVLHSAGAVHRDVKPANILLDRTRDRVVLVDVGVARGDENDEASGTPGFGAPESFLRGQEGPGTDVYGLAATTYMLLTGLAPFGGGNASRVVKRQLAETPAPPSTLRLEIPPAVDRVLARALGPDMPGRHASALDFARDLARALREPAGTRQRALARGTGDWTGGVGSTRGAVFRVAYRILGNRLGTAWVRDTCEQWPDLKEVMRPTVGNLTWFPIERLGALLQAVPSAVRDPKKVARELGRAAMTAVFARFYGADPATASPAKVLGEVGRFWSRLHSWGLVTVQTGSASAQVDIARTPKDPLICCLVEGTLERIAELAGAVDATARHTACESQGAPSCTFEVSWSL